MNLQLPPLPYALDALEPHISRRTLAAHHGHHHADYLEKTRALVRDTLLEHATLETIVLSAHSQADDALFNASAQAWNHGFYWQSMRPGGGSEAGGEIGRLITEAFGSQQAFRRACVATASEQFGSGWVWLVLSGDRLRLARTPNAATPLGSGELPLLAIDIWEHAYYLDYEHKRADHVAAWLANLANWDFANQNLAGARSVGHAARITGT
jgi:Fe-Mn family superoxide dismutase